MDDITTAQLKRVIQAQHGVGSEFSKSVRVIRAAAKNGEWDGLVYIFDLKNHPSASRAFAWASPIAGGRQPRYFAVLQSAQIETAMQAVKAASGAIRKWGAQGVSDKPAKRANGSRK